MLQNLVSPSFPSLVSTFLLQNIFFFQSVRKIGKNSLKTMRPEIVNCVVVSSISPTYLNNEQKGVEESIQFKTQNHVKYCQFSFTILCHVFFNECKKPSKSTSIQAARKISTFDF